MLLGQRLRAQADGFGLIMFAWVRHGAATGQFGDRRQLANHTAGMPDIGPEQRGVVSGLLSLSRNLGLITGASVMGAVFALASGTMTITQARPEVVATGLRLTFAVAAILMLLALAIAVGGRAVATRHALQGQVS